MTAEEKESERKSKEPIPHFASRAEEAQFWDSHDFADYWDEWKPVKVRFAKNLSEGIHIRLDPETLSRVRSEVSQRGIGPSTLIRMWLLERLQGKQTSSTS